MKVVGCTIDRSHDAKTEIANPLGVLSLIVFFVFGMAALARVGSRLASLESDNEA